MSALEIRRARRDDLAGIAALRNHCWPAAPAWEARDILLSFMDDGYLVAASEGRLCGAVRWHVENLVASVREIYLAAPAEAARALLAEIEAEARALQCEVILLMNPAEGPAGVDSAAKELGYLPAGDERLPAAWAEAVAESEKGGGSLWVKRLAS